MNRYNGEVNGYFLCDRGRFGYEFVNSERRIRQPLRNGKVATAEAALDHLRELASGKVIGIGSPRASLETNFALRSLVGEGRFYAGIPATESRLLKLTLEILRNGPAHTPSLHEVESADAVFILGEDVTNVAPRMALSLRQSVRRQPMEIAERLHIPLWMDHAVREQYRMGQGPCSSPAPALRVWMTSPRAHIVLPPTTRHGLVSRWRMRWIHARLRRPIPPKQCWRWRR